MSKRKAYGYDEDNPPSESGSDFDDDDDPDNLEVPGGGKTLAAAAHLAPPKITVTSKPAAHAVARPTTNPLAAASGMAFGQASNAKPITIPASALRKTINLGNLSNFGNLGNLGNLGALGNLAALSRAAGPRAPPPPRVPPPRPAAKAMPAGPPVPSPYGASSSAAFNAASLFAQMEMAGMPGMNSYIMQNLNQLLAGGMAGPLANMLGQFNAQYNMAPAWAQAKPDMWHQDKMPGDEEEGDDEEMGVAETYADYMPAKLKLGRKHPDPVVETASLSSVEPVDVTYKLSLPAETVQGGMISALQLEAVVYACQAHENVLPDKTRAGFLIGDGAGVGKGRTIAGIIYENWMKGRKRAIWVSVSNDLKYDAERDLRDIGAGKIEVYPLNKFKYAKISSAVNGNVKRGVVFSTYSALIGETSSTATKYRSRLKQLLQWCGDDFDGCIVFDECHKAKNLCPVGSGKATKTGLTALELQTRLPGARVVYASATGASEPRNMAYMVRLGIWGEGTPFPTFMDFINAVEKRGVGAMEIVAMDMKLRGMYIARQLSFHGVTFKIEEVPLSDAFKETYDKSVALWVEAMQRFTEAAELIDAESRMKKTMWGQFWSAHQRFFKYLCIAAKVNHAVVTAREAVKCGKCVVIGLQSTGEARTLDQLERDDGELTDFVSTAKGVFQTLVEKHFPAPDRGRINRLLGLEGKPKQAPVVNQVHTVVNNGNKLDEDANSSKRKLTSRQQANVAAKRARGGSSSDEFVRGSEDELELEERPPGSDSDLSDFNPFRGGSDSDDDPWIGRQKKKPLKKKKAAAAPKKKPNSTQDKIETMFERKNSASPAAAVTVTGPAGQSLTGTPVGTNGLYLGPTRSQPPPRSAIERACSMKEELLSAIERLGRRLPPNTLDQLVDELGGTENVAEMTGRKGRVVQTEDGQIQYESRAEGDVPLETLNLTEKQRFMDGEKDVAIISEAASSGISLQSDRRLVVQTEDGQIQYESRAEGDVPLETLNLTEKQRFMDGEKDVAIISEAASSGISLQSDRRLVVQTEDGQIQYESRAEGDVPLETLNLTEKQRFMDGEKDVAIISEAASSGISLQSDRRLVVQTEDGQIQYESRAEGDVPLETLNLTEKQRFKDGEKDLAIISEAASSGISLQSDRRARNQRRRVHITLELPWSADRAVQQFGRTHRSNQVNAPEYIFLISDLAGERRFASTVAKRLESLGALTHGDRRATETRDLSQFNIDNKYGRTALEAVMRAIMKYETPLVAPPRDYRGDFFQDVASALVGVGLIVNSELQPGSLSLDKDHSNMSKFLNRILGMPVELQNRIFKYFTDTLTAVMEQAKRSGRFDLGILDLGSAGDCVRRVRCVRFMRRHATGTAPVELHTVHSERGMDWSEALEKFSELSGPKEGFYLSLQPRNNKYTTVLAVAIPSSKKDKLSKKDQMFQIYRPNTGLQVRTETLAELERKYKRVGSDDAETHWNAHHAGAERVCSHAYWRGVCRNGPDCEVGRRVRSWHVLAGSLLAVWARVESVLTQRSALNKMQVVRLKTDLGLKIVGTVIPKNCVEPLKEALSYDAVSTSEQTFEADDLK